MQHKDAEAQVSDTTMVIKDAPLETYKSLGMSVG
jgi:hypothetical protein